MKRIFLGLSLLSAFSLTAEQVLQRARGTLQEHLEELAQRASKVGGILQIKEEDGVVLCTFTSGLLEHPQAQGLPLIKIIKYNDRKYRFETENTTSETASDEPTQHTKITIKGAVSGSAVQIGALLVLKGKTHVIQGMRLLKGEPEADKMSSSLDLQTGTLTLKIPTKEVDESCYPTTLAKTTLINAPQETQTQK